MLVLLILAGAYRSAGQTDSDSLGHQIARKPVKIPSTIFRDSDGNLVSNDEFVDIRMANFHIKDATLVKTLEDGTIEFRLQKVPQEGALAPLFSGKTVDGKPFASSSMQGKVVVLNFWFIGCAACRSETPLLNKFAGKFALNDDVQFIAITADSEPDVRRYLKGFPFNYTMLAGAQDSLDMFVAGGYPKNIVIGRDGRIVYWRSTVKAWDKFESVIKTELGKR